MKLVSVLASLLLVTPALGFTDCLDISGMYASPNNTPKLKTTFSIMQNSCGGLVVTSFKFSPGVSTTSAHFTLDGAPARNCLIDYFADCGSLNARPDAIEKVDRQSLVAVDEKHGVCRFASTFLTKDAQGNLLETIRAASCEDGYKGSLAPHVFLKQ